MAVQPHTQMNQIEHPAVIQLLNRNAERSDYRVLKGPLGEAIEPYIYHCMGIDVGRFVEAHRSEEAERSLLLMYENGPARSADIGRRRVHRHRSTSCLDSRGMPVRCLL